jgi:hypothetical protein
MNGVEDRNLPIEALQRMTNRLADTSLTVAEANTLRSMIHHLLDEISSPSPAPLTKPAPCAER